MAPREHKPYGGTSRKLLLTFDIGTTFSGVSYAVLDPGEVPTIQAIQRYPSQTNESFKIPSVIVYTKDGKVRAVGAEARDPGMADEIEDDELLLIEWFKLHLAPNSMARGTKLKDLDVRHQLPDGKTAVEVFADYLGYLYKCAREYIIDARANGTSLWDSVKDHVEIVLTHPNGWEGVQQGKMREAAVLAGLVPDTPDGNGRIHVVSEGEASLHYCIDMGMTDEFLDGTGVVIVDCGGGTIDSSCYRFDSTSPISVEESAVAECALEESTRVNARAAQLFRAKFANAGKFGTEPYLRAMTDDFEKSAKPAFKDASEKAFIKFGGLSDTSKQFGIRSGRFSVEGTELAKLFQPAIDEVIRAVRRQKADATGTVSFAFLVGGFAANTYLFNKLRTLLEPLGINLSRPDHHAQKAVAAGAASWFIENYVSARVSRFTYGTSSSVLFDPDDAEHRGRRSKVYPSVDGFPYLPDAFVGMIAKGARLREGEEIVEHLMHQALNPDMLNSTSCDILCYRGKNKNPRWTDKDAKSYTTLATVRADTSKVKKLVTPGLFGLSFVQQYDIVLSCGKTELTAHIRWEENGVEKRGPATIVYNEDA